MRQGLVFLAALALASATLHAATLTVVNTADSGAGSLRQAILDANAAPGADTIEFHIPGGGIHTVAPLTPLPDITETATIDGYTQPGAAPNTDPIASNAVILIALDGSAIASGVGLRLQSGGSVVQGLALHNWDHAIEIGGGLGGCTIRGCLIGKDVAGSYFGGNSTGIEISSPGTLVGGSAPADRNVISGNGIGISAQAAGAVIQGNLIGTDATGTRPVANGIEGIECATPDGTGTEIGGSGLGEGNVISGNSSGIAISGNAVNVVQGNKIGVDAAGTGPLANTDGIYTFMGGNDSVIGGTAPGEANIIAYNIARGVMLWSGSGNSVRGNSIHDNGLFGIMLSDGTSSPHPNDPGDADTGPNSFQNFPVIQSVTHLAPTGASTEIFGKFNSTPSTTFTLDFYANPGCSRFPREYLEGETWLGSAPVTTDAGGDAPIDVVLPVQTDVDARISATATDPAGNTSEFSQRIVFSLDIGAGGGGGGRQLHVAGTDFADPTTLTFGGVTTFVTFVSDHELITYSPVLDSGAAYDVVATTPDGTTGTLVKGWVAEFIDVQANNGFYPFVNTLVANDVTAGIGGGRYGINAATLRRQMAVFLLRARHGLCYTPPPCIGVFADVACPSAFADWIEALAAEGITGGCGAGNYCPDSPIRRDQMAALLLKAEHGSGYAPPSCTGIFTDVACPSLFADWIERLAAESITGGCGGGNYCPLIPSTRGQMAVFVVKTFQLQ